MTEGKPVLGRPLLDANDDEQDAWVVAFLAATLDPDSGGDAAQVRGGLMSLTPTEESAHSSRVFLEYPANWDELTDDEQMAVALGMAVELQRRLGTVVP